MAFKSSERDSERLLAPETKLWFLSKVSAVSTAQELQADRPERVPRDSSGG